ncbi:MAG: phosphoenolpyruvate--protein phosphotransferase [Clostridia bacterium]|nr:phosphoenolpyruvate--protein phosphotransferase [Clostridia bacterium]
MNECVLRGIPVSPGVGIGKAFVLKERKGGFVRQKLTPEEEKKRYARAADSFGKEALANAENIKNTVGENAAKILRSHAALAADPYSRKSAEEYMESGMSAEETAEKVWGEWRDALKASPDRLTRERAGDAEDILKGILSALEGNSEKEFPSGCVLVCREFTPSLAAKSRGAAAVVSKAGGVTSHGAILACSMGIPCIMGVDTEGISDGAIVICDGRDGTVIVNPDESRIKQYETVGAAYVKQREELKKYGSMEAVTPAGKRVLVECNAGSLSDVQEALKAGGDGVGLFRTEFLFAERDKAPDAEEQYSVYKTAAQTLAGRPLTIRILDAGGDKKIPYLNFPQEENPFLGLRGIRFCLREKELFKCQIKAILRAGAFGDVRILIPMVTMREEVLSVRELIGECRRELLLSGYTVPENIPVGVMIETPAAAVCADKLSECSDFFSVGTNDLTQYIMAADRGNKSVSYLYSPKALPVVRAVEMTARAARKTKIPLHVCGEAACDPEFLSLLINADTDAVSVSPGKVASVKYSIITGKSPQ